ncbi:MAG: SRPBCC family protein [Paludibacteraceae bacterium]|nr:SRPBCC family protein [Paludibacteraceae bacterium]
MNEYTSSVKKIEANADEVYSILSNLENISRVKDLIPEDKIKDLTFTPDSLKFKVDGLGQKVGVRIIERDENKTIKFAGENIPAEVYLWIQLKQVATDDTRVKLTLRAELPMMFKMMLDNKLKDGIEQAAEYLSKFPYKSWK